MTKIVIICLPGDVHVSSIAGTLGKHFLKSQDQLQLLYPNDIAHMDVWSFSPEPHSLSRRHKSENLAFGIETPDTVWFRRFPRSSQFLDIEDLELRANTEIEVSTHMLGCLAAKFYGCFQINPITTALSTLKHLQLVVARDSGLNIPKTLFSNDPFEIREFGKDHKQIIFKPLTGVSYRSDSGKTSSYTLTTVLDDLSPFEDEDFIYGPGIYQTLIKKDFEVRLFVAGHTFIGMGFAPAEHSENDVDWRKFKGDALESWPVDIPDQIKTSILSYMSKMNLVSAMMDFIVKDNQWYFLEANPGGQFLFMEQQCPKLPILDAFCKFLVSGDPQFKYADHGKQIATLDAESLTTSHDTDNHIGLFGRIEARRVSLAGFLN